MYQRRMTVAHIRQPAAADQAAGIIEVMFLEAARIFQLPASSDDLEQMLDTLSAARARGHDVLVTTASIDSEIVVAVEP